MAYIICIYVYVCADVFLEVLKCHVFFFKVLHDFAAKEVLCGSLGHASLLNFDAFSSRSLFKRKMPRVSLTDHP